MNRLRRVGRELRGWLLVLLGIFLLQAFLSRSPLNGVEAPHLQGVTVNGPVFTGLDALPKPALVYFWASWCGVCKLMQGTVSELAHEVPLITVATQSGDRSVVAEYMKVKGFEVPTLLDESGALAERYGVRGVPSFFILDREGRIAFSLTGLSSGIGLRLRLWWAAR
mgnify:FL=1